MLDDPTNNHAVIVSSSRYWFNYRHVNNALVFYQLCKANGIPDENIILMLADDLPTNARNPFKNGMYASGPDDSKTLYDASIEIDYRGEDVNVENLARVLLGRQGHPVSSAASLGTGGSARHQHHRRRLHLETNENSNILIFLTGHGGDQFFKFQDIEEITSEEIASIIEEMHRRKRYKEVLLVADTCQAFTLGDHISSPNVMMIGSSLKGESSYAHHSDSQLGLSVMERYTYSFWQYLNNNKKTTLTMNSSTVVATNGVLTPGLTVRQAMVDPYPFIQQRANIGFRDDLMKRRDPNTVLLSDFFANNELLAVNNHATSNETNVTTSHSGTIQLVTSSNVVPLWPRIVAQSHIHQSKAVPLSISLPRRLLVQNNAGSPDSLVNPCNPSDAPFLALLAAFLSLVLALSSRRP